MIERRYNQKNGEPALNSGIMHSRRYWELDFLRGLCVILMVVYHFFVSATYFVSDIQEWAGKNFWPKLETFSELFLINNFIQVSHFIVISIFLLLCGISCTLSHNNTFRGVKACGAALVITMATWLIDSFIAPGILITFGVIHMLACAMLLYSLTDFFGWLLQSLIETKKTKTIALWVRKMTPAVFGVIGLILYFTIPLGHFAKGPIDVVVDGNRVTFYLIDLYSDIPATDSTGLNNFLSMIIYLKGFSLQSSDCFSIFPYAFVVLIGGGIGQLVYHTRAKTYLVRLDGKWNKPITFVGRHALLVYLLHQLAIVAFLFAAGGIYSLIK